MSQLLTAIVCCVLSATASTVAVAQRSRAPDFEEVITRRLDGALDSIESGGEFVAAQQAIREAFEQVIAWGDDDSAELLREAAFAARLARLAAASEDGPALVARLRANPKFAGDLLFLIEEERESLAAIAQAVDRVASVHAVDLESLAPIAAAMCVVYDAGPVVRRFNENVVKSPGVQELLAYYTEHAHQLYFPIDGLPPELYVHVVDATPAIEEMRWAMDRYAGHNDVGGLFRTIRYDHESLLVGREKNVTKHGYTLPNLLRHGGVCADQAYFAVMVGKSIGVPTAYVWAAAAGGSHAWVGFLQRNGRGARWNFSTGRYDAYKGVKGVVHNPQTGEKTSDAEITLAAGLIEYSREERQRAVACIDAAKLLLSVADSGGAWPPQRIEDESRRRRGREPEARRADAAGVLGLIEKSVEQCPYQLGSWKLLGDTAQRIGVSADQRRDWIDKVQRLCGREFPDFTVDVLRPVIGALDDPREKDRLWSSLLRICRQRPDLSAEILTAQGDVWAEAGDAQAALERYREVLNRHTEAGPYVIDALERADAILASEGREHESMRLHQTTWGRCTKPEIDAYYRAGSNWFRIGLLYAKRLQLNGDAQGAQRVLDTLRR